MTPTSGESPAFTLAAFGVALLLAFLLAFWVGRSVGPFGEPVAPGGSQHGTGTPGGSNHGSGEGGEGHG